MAYGRKYYKEFDGYNAATRQSYTVLVDIYEDGFAGSAIEIEEISASPLQLSLDSSGDPLYTAVKKTSATFNIINTNQFDYSEFYTSNAKKYKMMITSTVFNWTGYLVPQAVSFDLATNGEFSLTASDGLHLLQSIDYVAAENDMTTLADFLTDIETKIGLSTFNRTSTINTEYGDIWNSLIYEGMFTNKTYEEAFEMVLKAIGMQVRYWKITPIISMESALQTASVKCVNDYPELNFLAPIKTAKLTKNITTLPNALKGAMVDDVTDITDRLGGYYTLSNWVIAANNGLPVSPNELQLDTPTEKYKAINVFAKPTNLPYDVSLSGDMHSYFNVRPIRSSQLTLVFSANFGRLGRYAKFVSGEGFKSFVVPVKWSTIRWSLYDTVSNKSFNKTSGAWDITGVPTKATSNEIKVTNPADSYVDILVEVATPQSVTNKLRFYLFTSDFEASSVPESYGTQFSRLSIKEIKLDGVEVVSENELYTATIGNVAVGDNIDKLSYEVDFGSVPTPPLNTSLYYGSAFFDNNLNQLEDIIIGANTVSHEQYLFNTILYTQNEIRKKVYTANVNMLTNVSPFWLKTTLKSDVVMVNACSFDFKTSQLNGEFTEIMPYVYREWAITSESEIGSSDWGGSGGTTGTGGGGGTVVSWGTEVAGQSVQLIVAAVTKTLALAGHTHSYLPLTGGVLSGNGKIEPNGNITLSQYQYGGNATGLWWKNIAETENIAGIGALTINGELKTLFLGWGASPWNSATNLSVSNSIFTYKNYSIWHAGNDGAGSGLDADLLDGFQLNSIIPIQTGRDFVNGTLITTSIDYSKAEGSAFYLEIKGNVYVRNYSCYTQAQGYIYSNSIINYGVTHLGYTSIEGLIAINVGGYLCFWFPRQEYWEGYSIIVLDTLFDSTTINRVTSVTDVAKPSGTKEVNLSSNTKRSAFTNSNVASATKLQTSRTIWGQSFNGEGNVDGRAVINYAASNGVAALQLNLTSPTNTYPYGLDIQNSNTTTGVYTVGFLFGINHSQNNQASGLFYYDGNNSINNRFSLGFYNNDNLFTIKADGNVGIGTTSTSYKLDVSGTFRSTESGYINGNLYVGSASVDKTILTRIISSHDSGLLALNPWGGNVVIGAQNAIEKLYVNGSTKINGYFRVSNDCISAGEYENNGYGFINVCRTASIENASYFSMVRASTAAFGIGLSTDNSIIIGGAAPDKTINNIHLKLHSDYVTTSKALSSSNRIYSGYDSGINNSISCSNWFRSNGESGWFNDSKGTGIYSDTSNVVRTFSTNKFKVYNTESDSISTLGGVLANGAVVAKYLSSTFATDWPVMTASVQGVAKAGSSLIANAGTLDQRRRHYTTTTAYTDAAARDITAKIALGTGNMTSGTLDQIQLSFAPLTTTFGLTANVIITQTGAGAGLIVSFREDSGTGRWYICIYNPTGATIVRDGIYLSINAKQTV